MLSAYSPEQGATVWLHRAQQPTVAPTLRHSHGPLGAGFREMSVEQLAERLQSGAQAAPPLLLLDVRSAEEFATGCGCCAALQVPCCLCAG